MKGKLFLAIILLEILTFPFAIAGSQTGSETTYVYTSTVVYRNQGNSILVLDEDYHTFNLLMNTSWQTTYLQGSSSSYRVVGDSDGNLNMLLNASPIPKGGNITLSTSLKIVARQRKPPSLSVSTSGSLDDIPQELQKYTNESGTWLINNKTLKDWAYSIAVGKSNVLDIVTSLANGIGSRTKPQSSDVPLYPTETYDSTKGDCDDQSNLLITLCRILGIPAYLQVGMLKSSSQEKGVYWKDHVTYSTTYVSYHAWAIIYVPPWGWLPFDMTLGWKQSDPLSVVTAAAAWSSGTIQIMNITKSDWAGEGKKEREEIMNSQLYLQYDDILVEEGPKSWLDMLSQNWRAIIVIVVTIVILGFAFRIFKRRRS